MAPPPVANGGRMMRPYLVRRAITRDGVTQGIFPEGGLTRDGRLRPVKIGLLDYLLGAAADPALAARLHVVPVAMNYDRVLEDRTLLRGLDPEAGRRLALFDPKTRAQAVFIHPDLLGSAPRSLIASRPSGVVIWIPLPGWRWPGAPRRGCP